MTEQDFHHHKHEKKKLHQKVYFKCNEKPDVISYSKRANHSIFQKSSKDCEKINRCQPQGFYILSRGLIYTNSDTQN